MKDYLKIYKAKLLVLTPTFIGSGKEISKKEYQLIPETQKIAVYDPGTFYQVMKTLGKTSSYEEFLLNGQSADLNYWMKKNNIVPDTVSSAIRYSISWGDRMNLGKSKIQIMEFVKDPYGNPYVPGTSIKGMLRTILLGYEISNNRKVYSQEAEKISQFKTYKPSNKNYRREASDVENKAFRSLGREGAKPNDATNDVLQGLIVSDSKPLNISDLALCQKIEYHIDQQKKPLNILRESLKPGVVIEFTLTIDTTVCKYDADAIMRAIDVFNAMYYEEFLSKFGSKKRSPGTVYLGGGVGFVSKTFIYHMFKGDEGIAVASNIFKNTLPEKVYLMHKHDKDKRIGASPHVMKCTYYNGNCNQVGMCKLVIEPL